jgi:hypothetical protein
MPSEHCSREAELLASQFFLCRSRFTSSIGSWLRRGQDEADSFAC